MWNWQTETLAINLNIGSIQLFFQIAFQNILNMCSSIISHNIDDNALQGHLDT